jgi:hypothetical protein
MSTQPLFNYLHQEFGVSALETEMQEIINIVNNMTLEEQLYNLNKRLNRIEEQLATNHNSVADAQNIKYEQPNFVPDWKDAPEDAVCVTMDLDGTWYWHKIKAYKRCVEWLSGKVIIPTAGYCTNALRLHPDYWKHSLQSRPEQNEPIKPTEPDYTHLLPEGYEFCAEQDASDMLKVELMCIDGEIELGCTQSAKYTMLAQVKPYYRPIRKIKYHVAVHEVVTAEPDLYQPDWSNAPEGTVAHAWDEDGQGYWYRVTCEDVGFCTEYYKSEFALPSGLDWKKSLRVNPKLK